MPEFPYQPEQLTREWLGEALGREVDHFTVAPLGEGVGVIGLVTRVTVEPAGDFSTLIAKFAASAPENREVANTYNMYEREYQFYSQVAEAVPIKAPRCYHAGFDPQSKNFVLLLEDLQGYRLGDQVTGCTTREAEQVVDALAAFHRATWQPDQFDGFGIHNSEAQIQGMTMGFEAGWPVVHNNFPDLVTDDIFNKANGLHEKVRPLLNKFCEPPLCIAHGDLRLDNVFFRDDEIALVDFQATCKSAPEHDLAYFITQSLKTDVRNSQDWVKLYHEALTADGIDYPLEACRERYRAFALYFLCYAAVIGSMLDLSNERGKLMAETLLGNSIESLQALNAFDLIEEL